MICLPCPVYNPNPRPLMTESSPFFSRSCFSVLGRPQGLIASFLSSDLLTFSFEREREGEIDTEVDASPLLESFFPLLGLDPEQLVMDIRDMSIYLLSSFLSFTS